MLYKKKALLLVSLLFLTTTTGCGIERIDNYKVVQGEEELKKSKFASVDLIYKSEEPQEYLPEYREYQFQEEEEEPKESITNEYIAKMLQVKDDKDFKRIEKISMEENQKLMDKLIEQDKIKALANNQGYQDQTGLPYLRASLMKEYKKYLGIPYLWGGTSNNGLDCSGFVQRVYRDAGMNLTRTTYTQVSEGVPVDKLKPGDLIFFDTPLPHTVDHVGMYIGNNKMVHASTRGGVKEENLLTYPYKNKITGMRSIVRDEEIYQNTVQQPQINKASNTNQIKVKEDAVIVKREQKKNSINAN